MMRVGVFKALQPISTVRWMIARSTLARTRSCVSGGSLRVGPYLQALHIPHHPFCTSAAGHEKDSTLAVLRQLCFQDRDILSACALVARLPDTIDKDAISTCYATLLRGCVEMGEFDKAYEVLKWIESDERVPLSSRVVRTLLKACVIPRHRVPIVRGQSAVKVGPVDLSPLAALASSVFRLLAKPDTITFSLLTKACVSTGQAADLLFALSLRGIVRGKGLVPDRNMYTSLIAGCARQGDRVMAASLFADMRAAGIEPDAVVYSVMILSCAQSKDVHRATQFLSDMLADGIHPTGRVYRYAPNHSTPSYDEFI